MRPLNFQYRVTREATCNPVKQEIIYTTSIIQDAKNTTDALSQFCAEMELRRHQHILELTTHFAFFIHALPFEKTSQTQRESK